jgi:4-hydroxy-tetrahydrodipicolinate synthase
MITGCGTALVTPFHDDGSVDTATFERLVQRQIDAGIDFLVPCGTTAESPTLTDEEHLEIIRITCAVSGGRVPVIAGVGGNNTAAIQRRAERVEALGVNGLLSVTPYYNKPSQDGLIAHYKALASTTSLPIILYSVAGRTGVNIEPETVFTLAEVPNIVGIKEASGNISQIARIASQVPSDFAVYSGDDLLTVPLISLGGHGVISVASNEIPGEMAGIARHALNGDYDSARVLMRHYLHLLDVNFIDTNPVPVKEAMAMMGLLKPNWRLPLVATTEAKRARIRAVLEQAGLL